MHTTTAALWRVFVEVTLYILILTKAIPDPYSSLLMTASNENLEGIHEQFVSS